MSLLSLMESNQVIFQIEPKADSLLNLSVETWT